MTHLLIEPFWNGNLYLMCYLEETLLTFNRTILEWKLSIVKNDMHTIFRLLIEPFWNGNCLFYHLVAFP